MSKAPTNQPPSTPHNHTGDDDVIRAVESIVRRGRGVNRLIGVIGTVGMLGGAGSFAAATNTNLATKNEVAAAKSEVAEVRRELSELQKAIPAAIADQTKAIHALEVVVARLDERIPKPSRSTP